MHTNWLLKADVGPSARSPQQARELECSTPNHSYLFQVISLFLHQRRTTGFFIYFIFVPTKGSNQAFFESLLCLGLFTVQNYLEIPCTEFC